MVDASFRMAKEQLKCPAGIEKDSKCTTEVSGKHTRCVTKVY